MILFHDSGYRCLKHFPGDVDDRKPLEYEKFIGLIYGKLIADKGYIGRNLFQRLFVDGIQLAHPINKGDYAYSFVNLKRKNLISVTPLSDALNALIFALNDSANALVALLTKKFRISS